MGNKTGYFFSSRIMYLYIICILHIYILFHTHFDYHYIFVSGFSCRKIDIKYLCNNGALSAQQNIIVLKFQREYTSYDVLRRLHNRFLAYYMHDTILTFANYAAYASFNIENCLRLYALAFGLTRMLMAPGNTVSRYTILGGNTRCTRYLDLRFPSSIPSFPRECR